MATIEVAQRVEYTSAGHVGVRSVVGVLAMAG
jgi:hypothetical protein